jgi:hypothetical protein
MAILIGKVLDRVKCLINFFIIVVVGTINKMEFGSSIEWLVFIESNETHLREEKLYFIIKSF